MIAEQQAKGNDQAIGFTMIDNAAIERAAEVGAAAFMVYATIARHVDEQRRAWPGIERLASMTGMSNRWVIKAINTLESVGWLQVKRSPGNRNTYTLPPVISKEPQFTTTKMSSEVEFTGVVKPSSPGSEVEFTPPVNPSSPEVYPITRPKNKTHLTRPKRGVAAEVVFPKGLCSEVFKEAWNRWITHRKELRKPLTASTIAAQLKKLAVWGETRAVAAINHSITAGWTGIFEETQGARKNGKRTFPVGPGQVHPDDAGGFGVF